MDRHLVWPDLLNARDLGGLRSASGGQTAWRHVVRADNLNKLAPAGVAALNAEATRQAAMVAYIDDFKLMMLIVILAAPLILLLRKPRAAHAPATAAAE